MVKVMEEAGTVAEAREIFSAYYCQDQLRAQYLLGDAHGGSMIVEGDSILSRDGSFQVLTNFYQSHPELGGYPCARFATASGMLDAADAVTPFLMGRVLDATHQEGKYPTQYSVVYDLPDRRLHLFHLHDFHEYLTLDLDEELAGGARSYDIPALFSRVRLLEPADGSTVSGTSTELRWSGLATSEYELCIRDSGDPASACFPVQPAVAGGSRQREMLLGALSVLLFAAAVPARLRGRAVARILVGLACLAAVGACGSHPTEPPATPTGVEMTHTVSDLEPGTTYAWKLRARTENAGGFVTETVAFTFDTGG